MSWCHYHHYGSCAASPVSSYVLVHGHMTFYVPVVAALRGTIATSAYRTTHAENYSVAYYIGVFSSNAHLLSAGWHLNGGNACHLENDGGRN